MAQVEFFFDPVCPFAWVTSQWVRAVDVQRPLDIAWRPIALKYLNEGSDLYEREPQFLVSHTRGFRLLRVCVAAQEHASDAAIGRLYRAFGTTIHNEKHPSHLDSPEGIGHVLEQLKLSPSLAHAADTEEFDAAIRASTETALDRTGRGVGTPIITYPSGNSFFGPVISKAPSGPAAVRLWDAMQVLVDFPEFSELKRTIRPPLDFTGGR